MLNKTNPGLIVQEKVKSLLNELNNGLFGKEETLRIVLLSILSGESVFLLGEPGTAKSLIARRIADGFDDIDTTKSENKGKVKFFEYLMNQFSTPDEVFGPVSLEALKNDEYRRITDRFLPKAQFAFLDEIWKASPAIQNALLTILNEKKFHNGSEVQNVPLIGFIAASNELPAKGEGLEAIFDRFLVRIMEKPISEDSDFFDMITAPKYEENEIKVKLSEKELCEWQKLAEQVELPENCREVIRKIRMKLNELNKKADRGDDEKYVVSDRRWKKIIGLLKMSAFINGRSKIDFVDCSIISYCLWSTEGQSKELQKIVENSIIECIKAGKSSFDNLEKSVCEFENSVRPKYNKAKTLKKSFLQIGDELDAEYYFPIKAEIDRGRAAYEKSMEKSLVEWNGNLFKNQNVVNELISNINAPLMHYNQLSQRLESIKLYYSQNNLNNQPLNSSIMIKVNGGNFIMGSLKQDEGPMHTVTLSSFCMGSTPVTYGEFCNVMGIKTPENSSDMDKSVRNVSWYDAIAYCNKLSLTEKLQSCYSIKGVDFQNLTYEEIPRQKNIDWDNVSCDFNASGYRLPTESEWEFAARGGNNHNSYKYSGTDNRSDIQNSRISVSNTLGLYKMSGGVREMCWDWMGKYPSENVTNPTKPANNKNAGTGAVRVCRGGSDSDKLSKCTVTARSYLPNTYDRLYENGFRICKSEVADSEGDGQGISNSENNRDIDELQDTVLIHKEDILRDFGYDKEQGSGNRTFSETDFYVMEKFAEKLSMSKDLYHLAEVLGRHEDSDEDDKAGTDSFPEKSELRRAYRGNVVGFEYSNDISRVVPAEISLLKNPATENLLYHKFAEKQLLSYSYEQKTKADQEEKRQNKGPIVLCIDSSGSMYGKPEEIAKSIVFAVSRIAIKEKRKCYIISFSGGTETLDFANFTNEEVLNKLVIFLKNSFYGNTDIELCLKRAMEQLKRKVYEKSDIMVISDFEMCDLEYETIKNMNIEKTLGTRFHSMLVGNYEPNQSVLNQFDKRWKCKGNKSGVIRFSSDCR